MPSSAAQAASASAGIGTGRPPPELAAAGSLAALRQRAGGRGADRLGDRAGEDVDGFGALGRGELGARDCLGVRLRGGEQLELVRRACCAASLAGLGLRRARCAAARCAASCAAVGPLGAAGVYVRVGV